MKPRNFIQRDGIPKSVVLCVDCKHRKSGLDPAVVSKCRVSHTCPTGWHLEWCDASRRDGPCGIDGMLWEQREKPWWRFWK
jgi:hypothetical protein